MSEKRFNFAIGTNPEPWVREPSEQKLENTVTNSLHKKKCILYLFDIVAYKFALIYNYIERLETKEDAVLGYHCSAFLSSYDSPLDAAPHVFNHEQAELLKPP